VWVAIDAGLLAYVARGWALSGLGLSGLRTLLFAPFYVGWKLSLRWRGGSAAKDEWVRTTRTGRA
jgi:1,2-diacylglycerol 3-beta-glucosyltransferase